MRIKLDENIPLALAANSRIPNSGSNNITVLDQDGNNYDIWPTDPVDWKAAEEPIGISVDISGDAVWVAGLRDYKLTKIAINLLEATVVKRITGGIWLGKQGARPGLFAIGDMTGYVYNNFVSP